MASTPTQRRTATAAELTPQSDDRHNCTPRLELQEMDETDATNLNNAFAAVAGNDGGDTDAGAAAAMDEVPHEALCSCRRCMLPCSNTTTTSQSAKATETYNAAAFHFSEAAQAINRKKCLACNVRYFAAYLRNQKRHHREQTPQELAVAYGGAKMTCSLHQESAASAQAKQSRLSRDKEARRLHKLLQQKTVSAAASVVQSKADTMTNGPELTLRSTLPPASEQNNSTPFALPELPELNEDDLKKMSSGGLNIDVFGPILPPVLKQAPHWSQTLRTLSLVNQLHSATMTGRTSKDYTGVVELCRLLVCHGGIDATTLGLAWLNASFGSGLSGVEVNRSSALRQTTTRSNLLGSVASNEGAAKALADFLVFIYIFYVVRVGGSEDKDEELEGLEGVSQLLTLMGFDSKLTAGDSSRLGDFSCYLENPLGRDDTSWAQPPPLNKSTATGTLAVSLCVVSVFGEPVNTLKCAGTIGRISLLELSVIARGLTFNSATSKFDMVSITHA